MSVPLSPSSQSGESPAHRDHGLLPPWDTADLPDPLPFSFANALRTIGPGAILLAGAIGGGEWIVGPLMAVKYGAGILWISTVAIVLQTLFNLEAVRYTLCTGEPIVTGIMRLSPGPRFWSAYYIVAGVAQLATPALAASSAVVLFAAFSGRLPAESDAAAVAWIAVPIILVTAVLLVSGKSVEKLLERLSWMMIVFIFTFLVLVNVLFVPAETWARTFAGFLTPRRLPADVDFVLLGVFASLSGAGGLGNLVISNWVRDKGLGMGAHVGGIGGALAHDRLELKPHGCVFHVTPSNLARWSLWWKYVLIDQGLLWAVGCIVGMFLNVNLALAIVPPGEEVAGAAAGAFQARYMADQLWPGFWLLALLNGFWILYSTHLANTDCLVRTTADICWAAFPQVRRRSVSRLYALLLAAVTVWAMISVQFGTVLDLFKLLGSVASVVLAVAAVQILRVNTRFLPPELQPPLWRRAALVICALAYGAVSVALVVDTVLT